MFELIPVNQGDEVVSNLNAGKSPKAEPKLTPWKKANQKDEEIGSRFSVQKSMLESSKMKMHEYYYTKVKQIFCKGKNMKAVELDKMDMVRKEIFNEATIYKLYFDLEKLKTIIFTNDEKMAFSGIKIQYDHIEEILSGAKGKNMKEVYENLLKSERLESKTMAEMLKEEYEF